MKFNTGKLYQIKQYFWMLFPSKETAADIATAAASIGIPTPELASYWSKAFNCNVTYISENDIFCLLAQDGNFLKILSTAGEFGWIIYAKKEPWTKNTIEEVKEQ